MDFLFVQFHSTIKQKKEIYKKSEIKMTRDLVSIDDWTTFTIVKRQEDFAEIALKIWPRN